MEFELTILGSSAATPYKGRHPSAQILKVHNKYYLIDCGEGTQIRLADFGFSLAIVDVIFISHLHGDHFFGIFGVITSMSLSGRKKSLHIVGPTSIKHMIDVVLDGNNYDLGFDLVYISTDHIEELTLCYEDKSVMVESFPLNHRIATHGFKFTEKIRRFKIDQSKIVNDSPTNAEFLKEIMENKATSANQHLILGEYIPRSYAYCSDTAYDEKTIDFVENVHMLYHDATFLNSEKEKATATAHATAEQSAWIAKKANVGLLILGHFSARYRYLNEHVEEAKPIFDKVELAIEGVTHAVEREFIPRD